MTHSNLKLYPCYDNLIVTCTATKTISGGPNYRDYKNRPLYAWTQKLELKKYASSSLTRAERLYAGPVWGHNKKLFPFASKIFIASAGYGLISRNAVIGSYNATFSGNYPDSIRPKTEAQTWWQHVSKLPLKHLNGTVLIVATKGYIYAMEPELKLLQSSCGPDKVHIVTCGYSGSLRVKNVTLAQYGPPCIGLVQRAALKLLEGARGAC